ncbi:hypothetical protein OEZ85_009299 [Tetradesmus obliquus]|uniref:Cyclin N-terminal domain-containing protein n=1 Tax=Tetradesmus obliquus TaxID=3088 RepID=A0ABY8U8J1_TETOB|nr:hypothetical protein OEZ85_009299 [Tetradesmus obliquus]
MTCAVLPTHPVAPTGLFSQQEMQLKRKEASSFNEIGNLPFQMQQAVQKRIRLEPMPRLGQQIFGANQALTGPCGYPQLSQQSAGPDIGQAFYLLSDCEQDYLKEQLAKETKSQPNHLYLHHTQQEVDAHKRLVLVDWLIEVVDEFVLSQESLYLAISLLDRFLSMQAVPRCQLQLLGVTCLWVASKYEEVLPPALQDFVEITDNSYEAADLIRMESLLLRQLHYELAVPTPLHFLHQLLSHAQAEEFGGASPRGPCQPANPEQARLQHLAEYLLELALLTPETLRYRPSVVAASALQLACNLLAHCAAPCSRAACGKLCRAISAEAAVGLEGCMAELQSMLRWAGSAQQAPCVRDKYSDARRSCVALMGTFAAAW